MNRRDFIAGLLVASAIGRAQAQQTAKIYRIVIVDPSRPLTDLAETGSYPPFRAFFHRLRELGYIDGQNLMVQRYTGEGRTEQFAELAALAVRAHPDVMFVVGDRLMREVKKATDTIPVVTIVGDPIAQGIVQSLARPGGNFTGITVAAGIEIDGKRLGVLLEMVPGASKIGFLATRQSWEGPYGRAIREAARTFNVTLVGPPLDAPFNEQEYRRVFAEMIKSGVDALYVFGIPENTTNRRLIVELVNDARLPAIYAYPEFAKVGGLLAYGVDLPDIMSHAADQIGDILKGSKPSEIPFFQPTKFLLSLNLETARALGITVPPTLIIAADEVIE